MQFLAFQIFSEGALSRLTALTVMAAASVMSWPGSVSSSRALGNREWSYAAPELYPAYRDALADLCGDGVALADLTTMWTELLKHKKFADLTGNNVNHPSDFGHRIYAQVILGLLSEKFGR